MAVATHQSCLQNADPILAFLLVVVNVNCGGVVLHVKSKKGSECTTGCAVVPSESVV